MLRIPYVTFWYGIRSLDPYTGLQCCGSGMFIPDPDFYPSRIPDLGFKNSNKWERWKKFVVIPFTVATNFTKLKIILFWKCWRKKFGAIWITIYLKIVTKLSKIWVWDPGSEIREKPIPDPRSKGQKGTGSRIRNTAGLLDYGSGTGTLV